MLKALREVQIRDCDGHHISTHVGRPTCPMAGSIYTLLSFLQYGVHETLAYLVTIHRPMDPNTDMLFESNKLCSQFFLHF